MITMIFILKNKLFIHYIYTFHTYSLFKKSNSLADERFSEGITSDSPQAVEEMEQMAESTTEETKKKAESIIDNKINKNIS